MPPPPNASLALSLSLACVVGACSVTRPARPVAASSGNPPDPGTAAWVAARDFQLELHRHVERGSLYFTGDCPAERLVVNLSLAVGPSRRFRAACAGHSPGKVWAFAELPPGDEAVELLGGGVTITAPRVDPSDGGVAPVPVARHDVAAFDRLAAARPLTLRCGGGSTELRDEPRATLVEFLRLCRAGWRAPGQEPGTARGSQDGGWPCPSQPRTPG